MPDPSISNQQILEQIPITEMYSRFVYPFFFDRNKLPEASSLLEGLKLGKRERVWMRYSPAHHYSISLSGIKML